MKLPPGAHDIRGTTPSGLSGARVVSITTNDIGASKTMTLPLAADSTNSEVRAAASSPSRRARQAAAAAVIVLLLALASAAYFVLRGPTRNRASVETASVVSEAITTPAAQEPSTSKNSETPSGDQQAVGNKKQTAALETEKKTTEPKQEKSEKKNDALQPPAVQASQATVPHPSSELDSFPEPEHSSTTPGREGCVLVTVTDADGQPVKGARVSVVEQPDSGHSTFFNGHTGERGRWHDCGFTTGHRIRVAVMGPRGGILGTQQTIVNKGRNFVDVRIQRRLGETSELGPKKRRFFPRQ